MYEFTMGTLRHKGFDLLLCRDCLDIYFWWTRQVLSMLIIFNQSDPAHESGCSRKYGEVISKVTVLNVRGVTHWLWVCRCVRARIYFLQVLEEKGSTCLGRNLGESNCYSPSGLEEVMNQPYKPYAVRRVLSREGAWVPRYLHRYV